MASDYREYEVRNTTVEDITGIVELSQAIYPHDAYRDDELRSQITTFPEGQFVAIDHRAKVIGMSSCLLIRAAAFELTDTWNKVTGCGTIRTHDRQAGDTLYGVDTMVDSPRRCKGIGTELVLTRLRLARSLGVRMIRTGIRLAGYGSVSDLLTPSKYVSLVVARRMTDPALSFMLKFGFHVKGVSENYLDNDPESAGCAAILDYEL